MKDISQFTKNLGKKIERQAKLKKTSIIYLYLFMFYQFRAKETYILAAKL